MLTISLLLLFYNANFDCYIADRDKIDLLINVVERVSGGFSAGGGISRGYVMFLSWPADNTVYW